MALSKLQLSELLSIYGEILTQKQRTALSMYCDYDCSLGEIADEVGISRQGVRDAILKAEMTLTKLDGFLNLAEFSRNINLALNNDDEDELIRIAKQFVSKE